jgi:MiaB-like tRNA modifying enzyme
MPDNKNTSFLKSQHKTLYLENYGCTANKFDFEIIIGLLKKEKHQITSDFSKADIFLINTCGVKQPTEDKILEKLRFLNLLNKPIIITGCLPRINLEAITKAAPNTLSAVLDSKSIHRIPRAIKDTEKNRKNIKYFSKTPLMKLKLPKIRLNQTIEIIQISEGCPGSCSFCCVKKARGNLFSYPKKNIIRNVFQAVTEGAKEVWITSQDNATYGIDKKTSLAKLLKECCNINGKFKLRNGMMNPDQALRILPDLLEAYKNEKIFKFLHLPVQSGDDGVLKAMNRKYTVKEFKKTIRYFRNAFPEITLATDIICGFPNETKQAFKRTIELIKEIQPDHVNISRFFPRPNTPAEKIKQLSVGEIKARSTEATKIVKEISLKRNKRWLNWEGEIIVDKKGRNDSWIGRNYAYKPIVIKTRTYQNGKFLKVKITETYQNSLKAAISETH